MLFTHRTQYVRRCGLAVGENHNMSNLLEYIYIKAWIINSHPNNDICMS